MKWLFGLLCHLAIVIHLSSSQTCPSDLDADVIIIGAGMAGLGAAERLQENGINNILILEGNGRVGGRTVVEEFGGVLVGEGATWIHHIDEQNPDLHPLYRLSRRCNNGQPIQGVYQYFDSFSYYNFDGREINNSFFRWGDIDMALGGVRRLAADLDPNGACTTTSLREGLNTSGWTPKNPEDNWLEWFYTDYSILERPELSELCTVYRERPMTFILPDSEYGSSDFYVNDPKGITSLAECLAQKVTVNNDTRIRLNSVVTDIDWSGDDCVCVTTTERGNSLKFCGKYAIITVSVGVLRNEEGPISFVPSLPSWKREVINRFDMARYGHIYMEFEDVFWNLTEFIAYVDERRGRYPVFINLNAIYTENPKVLLADISGELVDEVLANPTAAISELEQILSRLYPGRNTTIVNWLIPDRESNPLLRGALSYTKLGVKREDFGLLAAPVGNLYFSGEATSLDFYATVHGAYLSGNVTAENVTAALQAIASKASCMQTTFSLIVFLGILDIGVLFL